MKLFLRDKVPSNYNRATWLDIVSQVERQVNDLSEGRVSAYHGKAAAAPTIGEWVRGDWVKNSLPSSSGLFGWICTESGSPGTWLGFGLIEPFGSGGGISLPIGAQNVTFSPSGIGAITGTVQGELQSSPINAVTQYGVSTSNTGAQNVTALTNALVAGSSLGRSVYIPGATSNYQFNAAVALPTGTFLFGDGKTRTVLEFTGAVDGLTVSYGSQTAAHVTIQDLGLHGSSSGLNLLKLNNASVVNIERVRFRLAGLSSIISDGECILLNVKDCHFSEASTAFWNVNSGLTAILKVDSSQFDTDTTPPIPVIANSAAFLVASGASLTFPTFINTNQNGGQANGMGSFCRVEGAMAFAQLINVYVEQTAKACILAAGSGSMNHLGIKGGHLHCIDGSNAATIDLNNSVAHFGVTIDSVRQTAGASVAVFHPGSSVEYSYTRGSRDLGNQHVSGLTAALNNVQLVHSSSGYIEYRSNTDDFNVLALKHGDADHPRGIQIDFTGGAPDDNTQTFLNFVDASADRFKVYSSGALAACLGTATPAGGAAGKGLMLGSAGILVTWGSGAPTLSAPKGSLYTRTDGSSTSTRLYVNTDGGTTWTAVTTVT